MSGAPGPISTSCHNCGALLHGPFCAACGQPAQPLNPPLRDVARDMTHELLDVDGKTVRSIRRLFLSPGFLTREYFEGRRVPWLPPIRLYLIFSLLFFAATAITPGGSLNVQVTAKGATDAERQAEELEALRKIGYSSHAELSATVGRAQARWMPRAMFVLVPLFAWFVQVARRRDKRSYPQHVFFALHVHAVWFACGAAAAGVRLIAPGVVGEIVRSLIVVYGGVYLALAFRTAYGGTLRRALLHAFVVGSLYIMVSGAVVLAIVLPAIFWHW